MSFTAKIILFISLSTFMASCGQRKAAKADFTYSLAGLVNGTSMDGGIYLLAKRFDENNNEVETLTFDLDDDDSAEIPFGTWEFYLLGFTGPNEWQGNQYCGSVPLTILDSDEITLDVTIDPSNCGVEPYASMALDKAPATTVPNIATWDNAAWDNSTWEP